MTTSPAGPLMVFCAWCAAENVETILQEGVIPEHAGHAEMSGGICPRHLAEVVSRWEAIKQRLMVCPFCGTVAPRPRFGFYARPNDPGYGEVMRCPSPECRRWFAPMVEKAS